MMNYADDKDYLIASLIQSEYHDDQGIYEYPLLGFNLMLFGIELYNSFRLHPINFEDIRRMSMNRWIKKQNLTDGTIKW